MSTRLPSLLATALLLTACTGGDTEDTDPADTGPAAPMINLIGEWWMPAGDRLPNQDEGWCEELTPDRFDDARCFQLPTSCEQGMIFDTPNGRATAEWIVIIQATECSQDLPVEVHASTRYAFFEWLGRNDEGDAALYRVNAREWEVREDPDAEQEVGDAVVVTSQDLVFRLAEDYRWEP